MHSFFALAGDIEKYALSCYLNELTTALTVPDFDNPALCRLLLYALYALEGGKRDPELVKAAFEWRIMAESGYAPDLTSCGVCGEVIENPPVCFSVRAGTAADAKCAGRVGGYAQLVDSTLRAMLHVLTAEPNKVYAFALNEPAREQFCNMAEDMSSTTSDAGLRVCSFIGRCSADEVMVYKRVEKYTIFRIIVYSSTTFYAFLHQYSSIPING